MLSFINSKFFLFVTDKVFEEKKLNIIRIVLGIVMLVRTIEMIYTKSFISFYYGIGFLDVFIILLLTLFVLGLFTPIVSVLLLFLYWEFDVVSQTYTLGSAIYGIYLTTSLLCNTGRFYSLDSLLLKSSSRIIKKIITAVYNPLKNLSIADFRLVYFMAFFIYAVDSFVALTHHFMDAYWYYGQTVQIMLTSSYLSKYYYFYRSLIDIHPRILFFFSLFSVLGQTIFQLLMLPLLANRYGRLFVIFWGLGFFVASLFLLQLGALAHVEIALWAIFFYSRKRIKKVDYTESLKPQNSIIKWYSIVTLILCVPFFYINVAFNKLSSVSHPVNSAIYNSMLFCNRFGYICPVVFNGDDLRMSDNWVEIYKRDQLVPFTGKDGQRIGYLPDYMFFGNHGADNLYFSNSLVIRRKIYFAENRYQKLTEELITFIDRRVIYDYNRTNESGPVDYSIYLYHNNSSYYKIENEKFEKELEGTFTITAIDGKIENYIFETSK